MTHEQIIIARTIAHVAHAGQVDKGGAPYVKHPEWVASEVSRQTGGHYHQAIAAAWLHDVLEDTEITARTLADAGVDREIISAVVTLTRDEQRADVRYYAEIKQSGSVALPVKLADIAHNTLPERLAKLDPETQIRLIKKYAAAGEALS